MNLLSLILGEVNWTNISSDWAGWIMTGYDNIFANWSYPLIFLGIIGYVYCVSRSAMAAAAAICIVFGVYGMTGIFRFPDIAPFQMLSWIIAVTAFSGAFLTLFVRKRT